MDEQPQAKSSGRLVVPDLIEPKNSHPLPAFHSLITGIFLPLQPLELHKLATVSKQTVGETRKKIITKFITNWREKVGPDIYPAFRLILPDKDNARQMYHLKENTLGRLLVKVLNLSKETADSLLQWKLGPTTTAGNFSERCYDILAKKDTKPTYGDMTIGEVNDLLDQLGEDSNKSSQEKIMRQFCTRMNAQELRWLIRIILRYSRIGVTEKTIFDYFHPDANALFNISSNLKRVCWQLSDPEYRMPDDDVKVSLMSCFQPQLAAFTKHSYQKIVDAMPNSGFYMEEKMDGERIQIHYKKVITRSGREKVEFKFYSRKAKDYTSMYGKDFDDATGALTKHLRSVIGPRVNNFIIDGEMVAWDPNDETIVAFGSLKTAANNEKRDAGLSRPMYVAFDVIYFNGKSLVDLVLHQRKFILEQYFTPSQGYFVLLPYPIGHTVQDIEVRFQKVIEQA